MEMEVLALTSKYAVSGVFCIGSIGILIISAICYSKGFIGGAVGNFTLCIICALTIDSGGFIANESQTKWLERPIAAYLDRENAVYWIWDEGTASVLDDKEYFIPNEEIMMVNDVCLVKSTGKKPTDNDYYIYDVVYPTLNVAKKHGGKGVPQWLWHGAAPVYIFGLFGLPAFVFGGILGAKQK